MHRTTDTTPFDLVLSRPPPEFIVAHRPGRMPARQNKADFVRRLEIAIGKAKTSLLNTQKKYKANFDKRLRKARKLKVGESVYLDTNDGAKKRDKLTHEVAGAFRILHVHKNNTVTIQRGDVVETVSANRVVRAPSSVVPVEPDHAARPKYVAAKNVEGQTWVFDKILDHRELDDGALEFKMKWSGDWDPSWEPRENVP